MQTERFGSPKSQCPICSGRELAEDFSHTLKDGLRLAWSRCAGCGFTFMNPPLQIPEMVKIYNTEEYWQHTLYLDYTSTEPLRLQNYSNYFAYCAPHLPPGGKLLDIGCCTGTFAAVAHRRGYEVVGIDPAQQMIDFGKKTYGIDLRPTTLEEFDAAPGSFDVISLIGTDSHFYDVRGAFTKIANLLRPGGSLIFTYQDYAHWIRKIFPRIKQMPNVYHNFTEDSLDRLLGQLGLRVAARKTKLEVTQLHRITRTLQLDRGFLSRFDKVKITVPTLSYKILVARKPANRDQGSF